MGLDADAADCSRRHRSYLAGVAGRDEAFGETYDVGGPEVMTYREMIERIARLRGKRRLIVEVPVLTPFLSSLWLHLVTPVGASVARPLVEGLRNPTVAQDERIRELVQIRLTPSTRRRATRYASSKRFPDGSRTTGPSGVSSGS